MFTTKWLYVVQLGNLQHTVVDEVWPVGTCKNLPQLRYTGLAAEVVALIVTSVEDISPAVKAVLVVWIPLGIWVSIFYKQTAEM